jgi:PAT family beta-lactamase induction signal transducer AmpG
MPSPERDEVPQVATAAATARAPSFWDAFRSPRLALMIGLGFAAGLPNPLSGSTLAAWLSSEHVSLEMIGFAAAFALPYNFKFLWAPLIDRVRPPILGRRRGWMLLAQLALVVSIGAMGSLHPSTELRWVGVLALVTAFLSASQDIAVDAYRTDVLPTEQRASGTAIFVAAYRGALIVAGGVALVLSDIVSWEAVYWFLAALMAVGIVTTVIAPAPTSERLAPRTMREAVVDPVLEIVRRKRWGVLLVLIMFYKVGDVVAGQMQMPFFEGLGFSRTEIGVVLKGLGLGATIAGSLLGGGLVARWGLKRSLITFGVAQAVANATYAALALAGKNYALMTTAIGVDNFMNGLGTAAFVAFLMTLCNKRFTATQYAIFSSLMTVPGRLLGYVNGFVAHHAGWPAFFLITIVAALPAIVILFFIEIRDPNEREIAASDPA